MVIVYPIYLYAYHTKEVIIYMTIHCSATQMVPLIFKQSDIHTIVLFTLANMAYQKSLIISPPKPYGNLPTAFFYVQYLTTSGNCIQGQRRRLILS